MIRLCLTVALVVLSGCASDVPLIEAPVAATPAATTSPYRAFAEELLQTKPDTIKIRPDLEARLDRLAATARRSAGRTPVAPSDLLRTAARAQALEMAQGNYIGHHSKSGYRFKQRFAAFADPEIHRSFGENAARESLPGPVDEAKAERLFRQWLDSGGHRRNLMNRDYSYVSTGAVAKGNDLYAVQIFWSQ